MVLYDVGGEIDVTNAAIADFVDCILMYIHAEVV